MSKPHKIESIFGIYANDDNVQKAVADLDRDQHVISLKNDIPDELRLSTKTDVGKHREIVIDFHGADKGVYLKDGGKQKTIHLSSEDSKALLEAAKILAEMGENNVPFDVRSAQREKIIDQVKSVLSPGK